MYWELFQYQHQQLKIRLQLQNSLKNTSTYIFFLNTKLDKKDIL